MSSERNAIMTTALNALVAGAHVSDLRRQAERRRARTGDCATAHTSSLELRIVHAAEARVVSRLAGLDDARELEGEVLLALIDGTAVAALSLHDQRVVANPFVPTHDVVALMRLRAEHLLGPRRRRRRLRLPRLRLA
jgi:hypothetical protein